MHKPKLTLAVVALTALGPFAFLPPVSQEAPRFAALLLTAAAWLAHLALLKGDLNGAVGFLGRIRAEKTHNPRFALYEALLGRARKERGAGEALRRTHGAAASRIMGAGGSLPRGGRR